MIRPVIWAMSAAALFASTNVALSKDIIHDAEFSILEAKNGDRWEEDDETINRKLAEVRGKNGGKPPNIVYILIDDLGLTFCT